MDSHNRYFDLAVRLDSDTCSRAFDSYFAGACGYNFDCLADNWAKTCIALGS